MYNKINFIYWQNIIGNIQVMCVQRTYWICVFIDARKLNCNCSWRQFISHTLHIFPFYNQCKMQSVNEINCGCVLTYIHRHIFTCIYGNTAYMCKIMSFTEATSNARSLQSLKINRIIEKGAKLNRNCYWNRPFVTFIYSINYVLIASI